MLGARQLKGPKGQNWLKSGWLQLQFRYHEGGGSGQSGSPAMSTRLELYWELSFDGWVLPWPKPKTKMGQVCIFSGSYRIIMSRKLLVPL